jgi:hypothetical protein
VNEITLKKRGWLVAVFAIASCFGLLGVANSAQANEDLFCWGKTVTHFDPCNQNEYELESVHAYTYAVHARGTEHSICIEDVYSGKRACSGGAGQDVWLLFTPTGQYVWPVIYINPQVKQGESTKVYGWQHYDDPPPGGGGESPPPPSPPPPTTYRYMLGTSGGSSVSSWSQLLTGMSKPVTLRVGDFTGDGKEDIVTSELQSNGLYRYMLGRSGRDRVEAWNFLKQDMTQPRWSATADFTGDSKADIISVEPEGNGNYRYMLGTSNGSAVSSWGFLLTGKPNPIKRSGDFNGDGKADIVSLEPETNNNGNWRYMLGLSNGTAVESYKQILSGMSGVAGVAIADLTGDGKDDIIAAEPEGNGKLRYMLGTSSGTGVSSWKNMMGGMSSLSGLGVADFTGDGKADVIAAEPEGNGKTRYMLGTSSGTGFSSWKQLLGNMAPLTALSVGDFSGDGKADIVAVEADGS